MSARCGLFCVVSFEILLDKPYNERAVCFVCVRACVRACVCVCVCVYIYIYIYIYIYVYVYV
jgi:hypothetical protein